MSKQPILGIVPARGGSKGVPGKNIRSLAGKPLIVHTLDAARGAGCLDRVIVTTDSEDIRRVVLNAGYESPFLRPSELARDETPLVAAITHALAQAERDGVIYGAVCLLQPTSPFRTAAHIRAAVAAYLAGEADTLVSVVRVPHRFVPKSLMIERNGRIEPYLQAPVAHTRHGDEKLWGRNGPAILISPAASIRQGAFYGTTTLGFPMDFISSIDIDEEEDWSLAERIVHHGG